jgi:hypothetical protein
VKQEPGIIVDFSKRGMLCVLKSFDERVMGIGQRFQIFSE